MTVGERMKFRRKQLGLSAETVAEKLNISPATIYRYENGDIDKVPGSRLVPIAEVLMTTPAFLMGWEENCTTQTLSPEAVEFLSYFRKLTPEEKKMLIAQMRGLTSER